MNLLAKRDVQMHSLPAQDRRLRRTRYPAPNSLQADYLGLSRHLCDSTESDQAYLFRDVDDARAQALHLARRWGAQNRRVPGGFIALGNVSPAFSQKHTRLPFSDLAALHAAVDAGTVGVILAPYQHSPATAQTREYLHGVQALCRALNILLIIDDTHAAGVTSPALHGEDAYGICGDIVILGEGLGSDIPLAALLTRGRVSSAPLHLATLSLH